MRLSIALCTYNGARFLRAQLQSLLLQVRLPDQVVICDDGSNDGTIALLDAFAHEAEKVGVRVDIRANPVNLGYVRNFEKAIGLCDGDVVFLCDQDDQWHADKLARYEALFSSEASLMVVHSDADLIDADGQRFGHGLFDALEVTGQERALMNSERSFEVLLRRNIVTGATMAFRRHLAAVALPVADGWSHDEWLAVVAAAHRWRIDCLDWMSIGYRQHDSNQIGATRRNTVQKLQGAGIARRAFFAHRTRSLALLLVRAGREHWLEPEQMKALERCVAHCRARASITAGVLNNVVVVWGEMRNGNYWMYSHGWRSLVADLLGRQ